MQLEVAHSVERLPRPIEEALSRVLDLEESEIDAIEEDHQRDAKHKMLCKWIENKGNQATWRALVRGFCLAKNVKLADHVIDICKYCMAGV